MTTNPKVRAQRALGAGTGRLLDSTGRVLDGEVPLKKARLQYQEPLTFQVRQVEIYGGRFAFAAILGDGSVVTWGSSHEGGDSSAVRDQLKNVQGIQATMYAMLRSGGMDPSSAGVFLARLVTATLCEIG